MKHNILTLIIFTLSNFFLFGQNQNNISYVKYKMKYISSNQTQSVKPQKDSIISTRANKIMESVNDLESELYFTDIKSLFKLKEKLILEKNRNYKIAKKVAGGIRIKNLKNQSNIEYKKSFGERLNISYPYKEYTWTITKEKKKIGNYICFKAKSYKLDYNPIKEKYKKFEIIAWFTPEIPTSFGPKGIDGLPGLVLEASSNNKIIFYANEIKLNKFSNNNIFLKPKGGINLTEQELLEKLKMRYD